MVLLSGPFSPGGFCGSATGAATHANRHHHDERRPQRPVPHGSDAIGAGAAVRRRPSVRRPTHLDDTFLAQADCRRAAAPAGQDLIETAAEPPAISVRNSVGTTRVGARGKKKQFHGSADQHKGRLGHHAHSFLGVQANEQPEPRCIAGSNRKRFDWVRTELLWLSSWARARVRASLHASVMTQLEPRTRLLWFELWRTGWSYGLAGDSASEAMNSINGRPVYARDQYSVPRKSCRAARQAAEKRTVGASGDACERWRDRGLGRRHYDRRTLRTGCQTSRRSGAVRRLPIKPTTESDPGVTGKWVSICV